MYKLFLIAFLLPVLTNAQIFRLNAIADSPPALITLTGSFTVFSTTAGSASVSQGPIDVQGSNLTSDIAITTQPGFEVSSDGTAWGGGVVVLNVSHNAHGSFYARLTAAAAAGSYIGNFVATSAGATSRNIPYNGTVTSSGTGNYRIITIPAANVANSDQTNFPVLISGTYAYLATTANGGKVNNSNGYDITFSSDAAGSSLLAWDVESYNPVTGQVAVWVKTNLSHTVDNLVYMHYGGTATSFQGNTAGTWASKYVSVWHMNTALTASGQTMPDVTSNATHLISSGSWTSGQQAAGKVGGAIQLLNASADYLQLTRQNYTGDFTLEGWFNITVADNSSIGFYDLATGQSSNWFGGFYRFYGAGSIGDMVQDGTATTINTWTHLVITRIGTTMTVYHNGVSTGTSAHTEAIHIEQLGQSLGTVTANIKYDEVRILNVGETADWAADNYFTQNSPSTFLSISAEH